MGEKESLLTPISMLPDELLCNVFRRLIYYVERPETLLVTRNGRLSPISTWNWKSVARVCHRWQRVILNDAMLWAYINDFRERAEVERHLDLSKSAGLSIVFYGQNADTQARGLDNLALALRDLSRVRSLVMHEYSFGNEWLGVQNCLAQPAPQLEELSMECHYFSCFTSRLPATFFQIPALNGNTKSFEKLMLRGYTLPPASNFATLEGLTEFTLKDCLSHPPNLKSLLDFLRETPKLTRLVLDSVDVVDIALQEEQDDVNLRCLQFLEVSGMSTAVCIKFLKKLIFPTTINWNIRLHDVLCAAGLPSGETAIPYMLNGDITCNFIRIAIRKDSLSIEAQSKPNSVSDKESGVDADCITGLLAVKVAPMPRMIEHLPVTLTFRYVKTLIIKSVWHTVSKITLDLSYLDFYPTELAWHQLFASVPHLLLLKVEFSVAWHTTTRPLACLLEALTPSSTQFKVKYCSELSEVHLDSAAFRTDDASSNVLHLLVGYCSYRSICGIPMRTVTIQNAYGIEEAETLELKKFVGEIRWIPRM